MNALKMNPEKPSKQDQAPSGIPPSLYNPDQLVAMAAHFQQFFAENNLISEIQGRTFVKTPGWQYAGARLGIVAMVEEVLDQSTEKELRYQSRVALLNIKTNQYVGCGIAICSNLEAGKKNKPAFAIQSQSQTRAIGKAYRNLLGWVVELAGFESDPMEETESAEVAKASNAKRLELLTALNHECISREERDAMFANIFSMSAERCEKALAKVQAKIQEYDLSNH